MSVHWFDYILNPELLVQQLDEGKIIKENMHPLAARSFKDNRGGMVV